MINYNGNIIADSELSLSKGNRGFAYGDSLFETIRISEGQIYFLEDHYFRLMASMRMIRMEIPMTFTLEYLEQQITELIETVGMEVVTKIKFTVFRKEGGLYTPKDNGIEFLIETFDTKVVIKDEYVIDLYKDHYGNSGILSSIKSSNRLLNVMASNYAAENELDNCVLLNNDKNVIESNNANIFIVKGDVVKTPHYLDGCIKGVARKKVMELITKDSSLILEESSISPFDLQKADEIFLTNAIIGIQSVTRYRKKKFVNSIGTKLRNQLMSLHH